MQEGAGCLTIARIIRPRGNKGEVAAEDLAGDMRCFAPGRAVGVELPGGSETQLEIERSWLHRGRLILKFAGVGSISAAERLRRGEIRVDRELLEPLSDEEYYLDDLVGCAVVDEESGRSLGAVANVYAPSGGVLLLSVVNERRKELLVPFTREICPAVDLASRRIAARLPAGLEELRA